MKSKQEMRGHMKKIYKDLILSNGAILVNESNFATLFQACLEKDKNHADDRDFLVYTLGSYRVHNMGSTVELEFPEQDIYFTISALTVHKALDFSDCYSNYVVQRVYTFLQALKNQVCSILNNYSGKTITLFPIQEVKCAMTVQEYSIRSCKYDLPSYVQATNDLSILKRMIDESPFKHVVRFVYISHNTLVTVKIKNERNRDSIIQFLYDKENGNLLFKGVYQVRYFPIEVERTAKDLVAYINDLKNKDIQITYEHFERTVPYTSSMEIAR